MFDHMEIAESIYEGVVEPSYENPTQADNDRAGNSRQKRRESALSWNWLEKGESAGNNRNPRPPAFFRIM